jgi:glycosyltransferase involved in cell wall biosynthesis
MLCYEYPPIGGGGAKVVDGLTRELNKLGQQIDLVTMGFKDLPIYEQKGNLRLFRVRSMRLRSSICSWPEMIVYIFVALPLIFRLCRQDDYYINHTHFIYPDGILAYILKKIKKIPYIITAHGSDVPGYNPDRFRILHKFLVPIWRLITSNAEQLIIPSENLNQLVKKVSANNCTTIIPNGINLNKFSPNKERGNKILVVTRMFERKGVQYFIQALSGFNHNLNVNIVGEGPYLKTLKILAEDSKSKINFVGNLDNESMELRELYETSKIFVFTSEAENFPVVLLEAMIAGLAIITTNDTGCAEVVGDGAILVKSKDSLAIKEALLKLINDPVLCTKLGKIARKRAEDLFSWDTVAKKHILLYSSLQSKKLTQLVSIV